MSDPLILSAQATKTQTPAITAQTSRDARQSGTQNPRLNFHELNS
jgi:hypothetical protein